MFKDELTEKNVFILSFKFKTDVFVFVVLVKSGNMKRPRQNKT